MRLCVSANRMCVPLHSSAQALRCLFLNRRAHKFLCKGHLLRFYLFDNRSTQERLWELPGPWTQLKIPARSLQHSHADAKSLGREVLLEIHDWTHLFRGYFSLWQTLSRWNNHPLSIRLVCLVVGNLGILGILGNALERQAFRGLLGIRFPHCIGSRRRRVVLFVGCRFRILVG